MLAAKSLSNGLELWQIKDKEETIIICIKKETNNLNKFADVGDIKGLTKAINGGYIGLDDRIAHYNEAIHLLVG